MASSVSLDLDVAVLAHEKGEGPEKVQSHVYGLSVEVVHSVSVYLPLERIGFMATPTAVQAGKVVSWVFAMGEA